MNRALRPPPADLAGFPEVRLRRGSKLHRIHRGAHPPWWFSSSGHGRFDLAGEEGTCYLTARPVGAFLEVFGRLSLIAEQDVAARRLARLPVPRGGRLADCSHEAALAFGVTAAMHSQPDYTLTQAWARALAEVGFVGVRYLVSHDPAQEQVGIALFGPAGAQGYEVAEDGPIPYKVIAEARMRYGLLVVPTP